MSTASVLFTKAVSLILSLFFLPLNFITLGIDEISSAERTDDARTNIAGVGAYTRSQGIACDGEHFYFSSKTTLICTEKDSKTVIRANLNAIPDELYEKYGIRHIGGISYYNGKIYAGMEDSKVWDYPIVGVFDSDTLELENYYIMDSEIITRGMPWVTVNPDNGYLYCMDHSKKPEKILVYDTADNMKFVREVKLSSVIESIQGAEFHNGIMFVATNDETQAIYSVNADTGEYSKLLDRNLTNGSEGEGMTFMGDTLVAIDLGPLFVNAFVREYYISTIQ